MVTPNIDVKESPGIRALFEGCHMDIPPNGKVTREQIATVYQIGMKKIGENADLEYLRRENMVANAGRRRK
jgi:hypothetical protein